MKQATRFGVQPAWKVLLRDLGVDPAAALRLAGLPADLFARKEASLTPTEYFRLWHGLEQAAGADNLPLRIGRHIAAEVFDPPIFASLCSANLRTALQRLAQFKRLIGPLTLTVETTARETCATLDCYGNDGPLPPGLAASELVFLAQLARLGTRQRVVPLRVEVVQASGGRDAYREYFGVPLSPGPANRIAFAAADAEHPFLTENPGMWAFFEDSLARRLADLDSEASMAERVRGAIREMLPAGASAIEEAAERLGMSKRTLQRKLAEESSSYQEVLTATRRDLAHHYLARSTVSLAEIAYLLGFQDGNSFIRAFRGWAGQTPGEYRADHRHGASRGLGAPLTGL